MERLSRTVSAVALVASPLLFLAYFVVFPAYGELDAATIARELSADPGRTQVADVFGFTGAFLAIPATLAFLRILRPASPRLAILGSGLAVTGWVALVGALVADVVAAETGTDPALFEAVYSNPIVVALEALAGLHIIGGVLLGVALMRSRLVAVPLAVTFTVALPVHFAANLAGQLWLDAITWLVAATTGAVLATRMVRVGSGTLHSASRPAVPEPAGP